jgi:N-acyl-D-amino-acid deacylase
MKKILLSAAVLFICTAMYAQEADIIIKNGKLIDGTGNQWQYKDVAISKNKIVAIGQLKIGKQLKLLMLKD